MHHLGGIPSCLIQGKEGRIQVLAIEVAKVVLAPPWRHSLLPDPREGGRDTGDEYRLPMK